MQTVVGAGKSGGYNSNYGGAYLYLDLSEVEQTFNDLKAGLSEDQAKRLLRRTLTEGARKVKTILKTEIPQEYEMPPSVIDPAVKRWKQASDGIGAVIPIKDHRHSIGGRYAVTTGHRGRPKKGVKYKLKAKIVKGTVSTLPDTLPHQGGNPPFRPKHSKMVFTRKYKNKALPIMRVVGLGVPQMPVNRSLEAVQDEIRSYILGRLEHNYRFMFGLKNG